MCVWVGACGSVCLCAGTRHLCKFFLCFFCSACCCCCRIMSCVSHRSSSSLLCGSHGTTAVAHQVCVDHYDACVDITYVCLSCVCHNTYELCVSSYVCVWVRAGLYTCVLLKPHISAFCFFSPLAAAAAVSCRLYHTVP